MANIPVIAEINNLLDADTTAIAKTALGVLGAVTTGNASIVAADLASNAVITTKILNANVTAEKLANTGVTAAAYTNANITVDSQGRITAAANGSAVGNIIDNTLPLAKLVTTGATAGQVLTTTNGANGAATWESASSAGNQISFYDRFDDTIRYPDGTPLYTNVTLPRYGNAWRLRYNSDVTTSGTARVVNGKLQTPRGGGFYLSANVTLVDNANFSMGVEFIRDPSFTAASSTNNFTIAIGGPDIVIADGSGINVNGRIHINMDEIGITSFSPSQFLVDATGQASATTDIITTAAAHGFESYDLVSFTGTAPSPTVVGGLYYVIKVNATEFKFALTRADVLANNAIDLTTDGGSISLTRNAECTNRPYHNGHNAWLPNPVTNYLVQGASSNSTLNFGYTHRLVTGDVVTLEGAGLPGGLTESTNYYVIYNAATSIKLATTAANAAASTAIALTTNGSASQLLRSIRRELTGSMPYGRKSIVRLEVEGDYIRMILEGVGSIEYYYRNMAAKIPKNMSFYWQSPPMKSTAATFYATYSPTAIWVDAPIVEENHCRRLPGYLAQAVGDETAIFAAPILAIDGKYGMPYSFMWPNVKNKIAIASGARSLTAVNNYFFPVGGSMFADGNYTFNPGFSEFGNFNQLAFAPGSVDQIIDTTIASVAGSVIGGVALPLKSLLSLTGMTVGYMEEFEICGTMTGTNAKRILVDMYNPNTTFAGTIFDSDVGVNPLNSLAVPWRLKILRKSSATLSHTTYATLEYNSSIIGPQRMAVNVNGGTADYVNIGIRLITADASGLVIESIRKTVHNVKNR
jgi:hypothetical protein